MKKDLLHNRYTHILNSIVIILVLFLLYICMDGIFARTKHHLGIVLHKQFVREQTEVGTNNDSYILIVKDKNIIYNVETSPLLFADKKIKDTIDFVVKKSIFTKHIWSIHTK